eukprot:Gb_22024 [translate_table: standard]
MNANPRGRGIDNDTYAHILLLSSYLLPSSNKLLVYGRQKKNKKKRCPLTIIYAQTGNALPNDLRLDLNDAAFDLSNRLVNQECDDIKRALGKCFKSVGRHFASTGEYVYNYEAMRKMVWEVWERWMFIPSMEWINAPTYEPWSNVLVFYGIGASVGGFVKRLMREEGRKGMSPSRKSLPQMSQTLQRSIV